MTYKNIHLYCNENLKSPFKKIYDSITKKENISFVEIEKGIVHKYILVDQYNDYGCVTDKDYNVVYDSCLYRGSNLNCGRVHRKEVDLYVDKEVIFLGLYFSHFGHELLDGCSRLWFVNKNNMDIEDYCYISQTDTDDHFSIFRILGIKSKNLIRVDKNIQFKKVIIPQASNNIYSSYSDEFNETFHKIGYNIEASRNKKIYLSRTQFSYPSAYTVGERNIEHIFENNGFKIVYPEKEKLETVISLMKGAEIIAGVAGSNMHNILFAKDNIIEYHLLRTNRNDVEQLIIDKMKNIESYHIEAFYEPIPAIRDYSIPYFIYLNKYLESFFIDMKIKYNKKELYNNFPYDFLEYFQCYSNIQFNYHLNEESKILVKDLVYNLKSIFSYYDTRYFKRERYKKYIDMFLWWIPIRKIRYKMRAYFYKKIDQNL